jgi:hypothetical protein
MEDDLTFEVNGRRPPFFFNFLIFWKWKTTLNTLKMEYDLNCFENGRRSKFIKNGRRLVFFCKQKTTPFEWKTTNFFAKRRLFFFVNRRRLIVLVNQRQLFLEVAKFFAYWKIMILHDGNGLVFHLNFLLMIKILRTNFKI